jgi:hypothetical protein
MGAIEKGRNRRIQVIVSQLTVWKIVHMHSASADPAEPASQAVLAEAVRALMNRVHDLGELAAAETQANEDSYRALVEADDLHSACRETVTLLLNKLAGTEDPEGERALDDIGRRRARQGVGMDAMLRSFRIDFRIVWELLIHWLEERPAAVRMDWKAFVVPLWQAVDEISVRVGQAYRVAEHDMVDERERDLHALFDELLHGTGPMSAVVRRIASRFGLGEQGKYVVVRADVRPEARPPDRALREMGVHSVWLFDSDVLTGIVAARRNDDEQLADYLRNVLGTRAGVSPPYTALQDTRRQIWMADAARDSTPPGSATVVFLADDLPAAFIGGAPEIADYFGSTLLAALAPAREQERARLLETVRVHLEGDGSLTETARQLFRHRNTVLNHLRRFEELTGLDLSRPRDIATALLALRAVRRLDTTGADPARTVG